MTSAWGLVLALMCVCARGPIAYADHEDDYGTPAPAGPTVPTIERTLSYYVHESFGPPNQTVLTVAGPNSNLSFTGFGTTSVFDNPIKDGADQYSNIIGFATGSATMSNHPNLVHVTITHSLNSTLLGVGTLEFAGDLNFNPPLKPSTVVVSGGTGDFEFLQGIATVNVVYAGFPYNTYDYTANLVEE